MSVVEYLLRRASRQLPRKLKGGRIALGAFLRRTSSGWTCEPVATRAARQ